MLSAVNADGSTETGALIDDIVREGARRMLAAALEADVNVWEVAPTDILEHVLWGFFARLDPTQLDHLRHDPDIVELGQNQQATVA